tara:strand:+ start:323 stop:760 length:438 start_codon:yes stop_codon:yes gene_type:complete
VKKKYLASSKDKKDWLDFIKNIGNISPKSEDFSNIRADLIKVPKLDLHGFSLKESNQKVKKFITDCFNHGHKKLLIVTGKGSRSKSYDNPYVSEKLSILRYSVPAFVRTDENLSNKIIRISKAKINDGGDGAIYIFLKDNKKFKE